ncbi:MAG: SDR family oxidoreductase, partial [Rhodothermales bacterium]|nr:SDR family oxidoreductase [Rhodothermales bacterium]
GYAIANTLLESGAYVGLHCRANVDMLERLVEQYPGKCSIHVADLSDCGNAVTLFRDFEAQAGKVDAIINNAGVALDTPVKTPFESWESSFDKMMNINLKSAIVLCREALVHFVQNDGGRLINIASRAAFRGDTADYMAYAASKGALVAYTRSIARAFGKQGVRAFILAPGFTKTDMADEFIEQYGEAHAIDDLSLERLTTPEDIAPIATLLVSGLADHATGCSIDINAGSYVH